MIRIKNCLLIVLLLKGLTSFAQIDVSISPISILRTNIDVTLEYRVTQDIGIELTPELAFGSFNIYDYYQFPNEISYNAVGIGARLIGKYYFIPAKGCDRLNIGPYLKFRQTSAKPKEAGIANNIQANRYAVGLYAGYKWVLRRNIIIELGLGFGKAFKNDNRINYGSQDIASIGKLDFDSTGNLVIGYRFAGKSQKE